MNQSKELLLHTQNLTILFAEDHDDLRINSTEILKHFFKKVDSVADGEEALVYYKRALEQRERYDLVLTDIQMPKMNGVVLTEEIYSLYENQSIVILSAHDETEYLLSLINLGVEQFIKKPIDYQELLKVLLVIAKKINANDATLISSAEVALGAKLFFNREKRQLREGEENIYLTKYEILFLMLLTQKVGKIYSNEDIVAYFESENESINPQNIRKLVSKLRKKFSEDTLESIYAIGYRLTPID